MTALCHVGANLVPSGRGCEVFADVAVAARPKMFIGNEQAVSDLWGAVRSRIKEPRDDRPGQPVFTISQAPKPGETRIREATRADFELLLQACAATHEGELGLDPMAADAEGFRRRTLQQIEEGRSRIWVGKDGTILFKTEASAWTPHAVQLQQVWVDPRRADRDTGSAAFAASCGSCSSACRASASSCAPTTAGDPPLRGDRHGPRGHLPFRTLLVERAIFVRHGESEYSARALVNGDPAVIVGLTEEGEQQARSLYDRLE